jgi:peptidoglycan hydrolase-like protein with peptidoglycan-binding domain
MGYLAPQKFSGRLGQATVSAIKAFQKANGMRETGTFTDDLVKKVYEVAGKEEPPEGLSSLGRDFAPWSMSLLYSKSTPAAWHACLHRHEVCPWRHKDALDGAQPRG